jgi:hypothetical protein
MKVSAADMVAIGTRVGFKGDTRKLPPVDQVRKYLERANKGDKSAAEKLLTWYRFSKPPKTGSEHLAQDLLSGGVRELFEHEDSNSATALS